MVAAQTFLVISFLASLTNACLLVNELLVNDLLGSGLHAGK
jgi:hypothetical protein